MKISKEYTKGTVKDVEENAVIKKEEKGEHNKERRVKEVEESVVCKVGSCNKNEIIETGGIN